MSGFTGRVGDFANQVADQFVQAANTMADTQRSPQELRDREAGRTFIGVVKIACIVIAIVAGFFLAIWPNALMFILTAMTLIAARDIYIAADNTLETLNSVITETM